jgi:hypothetical protein
MRPSSLIYSFGVAFLLLCFLFVVFPFLAKNIIIFVIFSFVSLCLAIFAIKEMRHSIDGFSFISLFCLAGLIYIFMSILFGNWTEGYDFSERYIFRHSYFIFFMPLFILSAMVVYWMFFDGIGSLIKVYGHLLLMGILFFDIATAFVFGSREFIFHNEYTYFMDKGLLWFFVTYIALFALFNADWSVKNKVIAVFIIGAFLQNLLGFGSMFTAATGKILFLITVLLYIMVALRIGRSIIGIFVISVFFASASFVFVAPFYSDFFIDDLNTYWRLESWLDNILAVKSNDYFGVGFGVSYFPVTQDVVDSAYRAFLVNDKYSDYFDQAFVRGQHSSLINIFFRMGAIGLILFVAMIFIQLKRLSVLQSDSEYFFIMPLLLFAFINISSHVGLENPPFLISFCMSMGAAMFALRGNFFKMRSSLNQSVNRF